MVGVGLVWDGEPASPPPPKISLCLEKRGCLGVRRGEGEYVGDYKPNRGAKKGLPLRRGALAGN